MTLEAADQVAVVGLAGRFPGASDVASFWANVRDGVESVTFFSEPELAAAGVPSALYRHPEYVPARALLPDWDRFDRELFGYTARDAEVMDPQQRVFLEVAWSAFEDAGHVPERVPGPVGVWAGTSMPLYLLKHVADNPHGEEMLRETSVLLGSAPDFASSRVAFKLGLTGPAVSVASACSTSLVAIHQACQALLLRECDMALAGGVSIHFPQASGYRHREGGILSRDGHCRAFDASASGTVGGSGAAAVVLRRLDEALADGDHVYAVVRGSAVNNDGAERIGFTAPSVAGQSSVIDQALDAADVDPATIGLVEAHGTGTAVGDPVEVASLAAAWRQHTDAVGYCALGSVKTNVGHLDAAAGVTGFVKAVMSIERGELPPSLHCERPNPEMGIEQSPFYVNTALRPWQPTRPRRAAVSSFGMGGTNAHVVLEQAPDHAPPRPPSRPWQILPVSARSTTALTAACARLADRLDGLDADLVDVAATLQEGRRALACRRVVVAGDVTSAAAALRAVPPPVAPLGEARATHSEVALMFPGQHVNYLGVGRGLYRDEPVFRRSYDRVADLVAACTDVDLRALMAGGTDVNLLDVRIGHHVDHPAILALEYALARHWSSLGLRPTAMAGHTVGEYTAACLAEVLSLEDTVTLVVERGRLMESTAPGVMLVVNLDEPSSLELAAAHGLSLAAVNGYDQCVVAGLEAGVLAAERELKARDVPCRRLRSTRAYNSALVDPVLEEFRAVVGRVRLSPPTVPFCSNTSGRWITDEQATDPAYWVGQLRHTSRSGEFIDTILDSAERVFVECGPGTALTWRIRRFSEDESRGIPSFPVAGTPTDDEQRTLVEAAAALWRSGVPLDWASTRAADGTRHEPRRLALPTYPFEGGHYRLPTASPASQGAADGRVAAPTRSTTHDDGEPSGNDIERTVAALYEELFALDRIEVGHDLIQLGADSLLMLEATDRLREMYQLDLNLDQVFAHPTIAGQATVIERMIAARPGSGPTTPAAEQ